MFQFPLRSVTLAALLAVVATATEPVAGKVYLTQEEALSTAFPPPVKIERRNLFLDDSRVRVAEKESGEKISSRLLTYYVGLGPEGIVAYAYFDTHLVRTLPETIMVLVKPDGTLGRVSVLSFSEPEEYLPRSAWMEQFGGQGLDPDLAIRRGIRNLTGASLTAGAITAACRRILALHHLVRQESP